MSLGSGCMAWLSLLLARLLFWHSLAFSAEGPLFWTGENDNDVAAGGREGGGGRISTVVWTVRCSVV